jgi:hypothetical protein
MKREKVSQLSICQNQILEQIRSADTLEIHLLNLQAESKQLNIFTGEYAKRRQC